MRRRLMIMTLIAAVSVGPIVGSLNSSASIIAKKTHGDVSATPRTSTFNRLSSGSHTLALTVGRLQRTFIVEVPAGRPVANRALVLVYHGATVTAATTVYETNLLQEVTSRGDVIAFLQGYENTWNEGSGSTPASKDPHVNDVAFTGAVIARLRQLLSFDPKRVAAVGFSNGAIMVQDLGCHQASVISLIVAVEGQLSTVDSVLYARPRDQSRSTKFTAPPIR